MLVPGTAVSWFRASSAVALMLIVGLTLGACEDGRGFRLFRGAEYPDTGGPVAEGLRAGETFEDESQEPELLTRREFADAVCGRLHLRLGCRQHHHGSGRGPNPAPLRDHRAR